jgi:hypothetical protein
MEGNRFFVFVPSNRKVDGHVRYRLEARAAVQLSGVSTLLNHECEKRLSECRVLKDRVEEIMGNRAYNSAIKATFPSSGFMGKSARLEKWLNDVVKQLDTPQYAELRTLVFDFLSMRESNPVAQSQAPAESCVPIVTAVAMNATSTMAVPVISPAIASWSNPSSSSVHEPLPIPVAPKTGPRRFHPTKFVRRMFGKSEADVSRSIITDLRSLSLSLSLIMSM